MKAWGAWRGAAKWRMFAGCEQSGSLSGGVRAPAFCSPRFSLGVRSVSQQAKMKPEEVENVFTTLCGVVESKPNSFEAIKEWTAQGNKLSPQALSKLYSWLESNKKIVQTLKILAGVRKENLAEITVDSYVLELHLICRQLGCARGEAFYNGLPEDIKANEKVKAGLIISFAKQLAISKVEKWMQTLNLVDVEAWNRVLELYLNRDKHEKLLATYRKMKEAGIQVTAESYCTLLQCRDRVGGGFEGVEKEAEESLQQVDITNAPLSLLKRLVEGYGYLKKPEEVDKLWSVMKSKLHETDEGFHSTVIRAFGLAGDLSKAEELLQEIVSSSKSEKLSEHAYVAMIEVYARLGLMEKAEEILKSKIKRDKNDSNFSPYDYIIQGYVAKNETTSALQKYQEGATTRSKLQYKTVEGLLKIFASKRDVESTERMLHLHYRGYHGDTNLYNHILKVYVSAIRIPRDFRKRMENNFVDVNEETEELLKKLPSHVPET